MQLTLTPHHAKYFAHDLTRRATGGMDRLSRALFDAAVDLNPHQIEAAIFALQSPLSKGVILADEVGLGKTIEAGIVLCQFWAEQKRRLLVICPASIRKQWALELEQKFNLPVQVLDAKVYREARRSGETPFGTNSVVIMSHHYANRLREELKTIAWDLVVIDEAHKLRNAYRPTNKVGQGIRWATEDCRKLLLTATPLQNSLLELYSVVAWIGAEMEFALSQAVASGDAFEHRPSECGHCVQNFLAGLDLRDLPGEAAGFELGADDTLPTADLRFYPAALVVPCGHLPGHAAVAADLDNMAIPNGWIPRRLRSGHCVLWRRYNHIQGLPIPFPQQIPCRRPIIGAVSQKARDRGIELIQEPG